MESSVPCRYTSTSCADVTRILSQIEQVIPRLPSSCCRWSTKSSQIGRREAGLQEKPGQTLAGYALVHEAYLRLVDVVRSPSIGTARGHFFAAAAEAMRRILVEYARQKRSRKQGGDWFRIELRIGSYAGSRRRSTNSSHWTRP